MATTAALRPLCPPLSRAFSTTPARRALLTRPRAIARPAFNKVQLRQSFRRHQSSQAPSPKPRRGAFRTLLLWTWRVTYLSALGGVVYLGYGIWVMRHPVEQEEPDPKKKTLVILGTCDSIDSLRAPICSQYHQAQDGALSPFSRNSTAKTTMLSSSPRAIISSSHPSSPPAPPVQSNTAP